MQAKIILSQDQAKIIKLDTDIEKATFVLIKISTDLQVGFTQSFYKILKIMKLHGTEDAQKLSATIQQELNYKGQF